MTRRELNLAIFARTTDKVLWQPRLETWIGHHYAMKTMPAHLMYLEALPYEEAWTGTYDALQCSMRYHHASWLSIESYEDPADIIRTEEVDGDHIIYSITSPSGTIRFIQRVARDSDGKEINRRIEKYPVTTPEDLRVAIDVVERRQYRTRPDKFAQCSEMIGQRGEPAVFLNSSGFTELVKLWCGLEHTFYLWADYPDMVEAFVNASDQSDRRQIEKALELPAKIFNLGDHATNEFTPPAILEQYMLPRWQWISELLHNNNRFVHSHWDGNAKAILPYLQETGLDSIEALTPAPQGDITLEEIKAAVGEKMVVLDLIPAIHFMEQYSMEEVLDFTRKAIDMFAPRLVLGISDEISQVGQIEKVEAITELVDGICGLVE